MQGRLEACSTCSKHTGAEGATTVNKAPNAIGNGAKRQMNTVKFWLEPALHIWFVTLIKNLKKNPLEMSGGKYPTLKPQKFEKNYGQLLGKKPNLKVPN